MMLFINSRYKPLKAEPSREICTYATSLKPFLPNKHPNKLIYLCCCSIWKCLVLWGVTRKWKRLFFNQLFGCLNVKSDLGWYDKQKNYMFKMMLLHPNATNDRVVFKLCPLLITLLTYDASKPRYIYEYTQTYI